MSEIETKPIDFGESEAEINYRGVSRAALLALTFGVLSSLALVHWLLIIIPVMAVGMGAIALRVVAANDSILVGRRAATVAIFLAMFFTGWSITRFYTRDAVLNERAEAHSRYWVELLMQCQLDESDTPEERLDKLWKFYEVRELVRNPRERERPGTDLHRLYGDPTDPAPPKEQEADPLAGPQGFNHEEGIRTLWEHETVAAIVAMGEDAELRFEGMRKRERSGQGARLFHEYSLSDGDRTIRFYVLMIRQYFPDFNETAWYVEAVRPGDHYDF